MSLFEKYKLENYMKKSYKDINYSYYKKKNCLLTETELKFYKIIRDITNELNLKICPQVSLYEIVTTSNYAEFEKISKKTIDFVITDNNLKIKCCIELDDPTHYRQDRIERDNFINKILENVGIKLIRIKASNSYDKYKIRNAIMGS